MEQTILTDFNQHIAYLADHADEAKNLLIKWAEINSGSYHLPGLETMHQTLAQQFAKLGGVIESHPGKPYQVIDNQGQVGYQQTGNILTIKKRWEHQHKVLLCGHMDTVFPKDSDFQTVQALADGRLNGPGVADMKGGLLVIFYALQALERSPFAKELGWQVVINADEEIGSLGSAPFLEQVAKEADLGLVYEPSMTPEGVFAGARKGSGKFSIVVTGKQAHAGRAFYEGRNAICHLAELITEINQLNDPNKRLTVNVGYISGGVALNVVPDKAVAKLDVRFSDDNEQQAFLLNLDLLIKKYDQIEGFSVKRYGGISRPAKPLNAATLKLFNTLKDVGKSLGLSIDWQPSGGCCDGNNLSAQGLPVIDTLGVRGGAIHSADEFMIEQSLIERSQLSALLLMQLAKGCISEFKE